MKLWLSSCTYSHIIWPQVTNAIQPGILCGPLGMVLSPLSQAHPLFLETNSSFSVEAPAEELWSRAWSVRVRWDGLRICQSPYLPPGSYANRQLPVCVSIMKKNHHCQCAVPLPLTFSASPFYPNNTVSTQIPSCLPHIVRTMQSWVERKVKPCHAGPNARANVLFAVFVFPGLTWSMVIAGTRLSMHSKGGTAAVHSCVL